ncbi:hypothetical protein GW12_00110 [Acinetobacter sp. HR7]|nr:hypothetical protein GW12_00110 [Acinetobacter sp. HR7]
MPVTLNLSIFNSYPIVYEFVALISNEYSDGKKPPNWVVSAISLAG